jgi:hypothetical protein
MFHLGSVYTKGSLSKRRNDWTTIIQANLDTAIHLTLLNFILGFFFSFFSFRGLEGKKKKITKKQVLSFFFKIIKQNEKNVI